MENQYFQRKSSWAAPSSTAMAEEVGGANDSVAVAHHLTKLSDVKKGTWAKDIHSSMSVIDDLLQELAFHWKLLKQTWSVLHFRALIVGVLAFLVGAFSTEILGGGDPFVAGLDGLRSVNGISFFQIILSLALWGWFIAQIWSLFPIMKGHTMNLISTWLAGMISMILFHATAPNFPLGFKFGEMLGGIVGIFVMIFLAFIVGRAVIETRDEHVQIRHFSNDERNMKEAMSEHSLKIWNVVLGIWILAVLINTWSGAHFVADRYADKLFYLILHVVTGPIVVVGLMHLLWFPQLMLGVEGTKVLSKRARQSASAPVEKKERTDENPTPPTHEISEGKCPECKKSTPIYRHSDGEPHAPCPKDGCQGSGPPNSQCDLCKSAISSRWTCGDCGVNAPLVDYLPDGDAW